MKKLLLSLATTTSLGGVALAVTSCSTSATTTSNTVSEENYLQDVAATGELTFGMRANDSGWWEKVKTSFEKETGWHIKDKVIGDQKKEYGLWSSIPGAIPDVSLFDHNAGHEAAKEGKWFQAIRPEEFLGSENADFYNIVDGETVDWDNFNKESLISYQTGKEGESLGVPYQYGSKGIFVNMKKVDAKKTIRAFVPNKNGTIDEVNGVDLTGKTCTLKNMQKFLDAAGVASSANDELNAKHWFGFGPSSLQQRIMSLGQSCYKDGTNHGAVQNIGLGFDFTATYKDLYNQSTYQIDDNKLLDLMPEEGINRDFAEHLYYSSHGYWADKDEGGAVPPPTINQPGEADGFWNGESTFLYGQKWMTKMIKEGFRNNGTFNPTTDEVSNYGSEEGTIYTGGLAVLRVPYGSIAIDALGISREADRDHRIMAKKFIRYALSSVKANSSEGGIPGSWENGTYIGQGAIPVIKSQADQLINTQLSNYEKTLNSATASDEDKAVAQFVIDRSKSWYDFGFVGTDGVLKQSDSFKGFSGGYVPLSTDDVYGLFAEKSANPFNIGLKNSEMNFEQDIEWLNECITQTYDELALLGY